MGSQNIDSSWLVASNETNDYFPLFQKKISFKQSQFETIPFAFSPHLKIATKFSREENLKTAGQ